MKKRTSKGTGKRRLGGRWRVTGDRGNGRDQVGDDEKKRKGQYSIVKTTGMEPSASLASSLGLEHQLPILIMLGGHVDRLREIDFHCCISE